MLWSGMSVVDLISESVSWRWSSVQRRHMTTGRQACVSVVDRVSQCRHISRPSTHLLGQHFTVRHFTVCTCVSVVDRVSQCRHIGAQCCDGGCTVNCTSLYNTLLWLGLLMVIWIFGYPDPISHPDVQYDTRISKLQQPLCCCHFRCTVNHFIVH